MTTLTLADGTVIDTRTGKPERVNGTLPGHVVVPKHSEARDAITRVRKRLADLPDVPERMNVIGVIAAYYMFGLDDYEIALAINASERQVANIKMTDAFTKLIDAMSQNIVEGQQEDVRALINENAHRAVTTLTGALGSEDEKVAIVAAKDILDRAGHRPNDVVEHRHKVEGGLTIEYVSKGGKDDEMPAIDVTPLEDN